MSMIDILRKFIRAEHTGNWELQLQSIQAMLPYMAASGHNSYTKSGMLYLQQMSNIPTQHPDVQQHFSEGLHVVRRRNRLWAGLSSDERPKGKAGATVTVAANMTTTMKKDQFLANRKKISSNLFSC